MSQGNDAKKIIRILEAGNYYIDCPCCDESMLLKNAHLFFADNRSPEGEAIYNKLLLDIEERKRELHQKKRHIVTSSERGAEAVNTGLISERIAPSLRDFPFDMGDCRSLFKPIDYLVFEGLSKTGRVDRIYFVEIKTGGARLNDNQKDIKALVDKKKVYFKTYKNKTEK